MTENSCVVIIGDKKSWDSSFTHYLRSAFIVYGECHKLLPFKFALDSNNFECVEMPNKFDLESARHVAHVMCREFYIDYDIMVKSHYIGDLEKDEKHEK